MLFLAKYPQINQPGSDRTSDFTESETHDLTGSAKMIAAANKPIAPQAAHNRRRLAEKSIMPRLGPQTNAKAQTMP
jgi:hypothetical protein